MKQLILGLALLSSIGNGFAESVDIQRTRALPQSVPHNAFIQETNDTKTLESIMHSSQLYALLLSLDSSVPEITREAKYVLLFNEMHLINKNLASIAELLKRSATISANCATSLGGVHG